MVMTMMSKTHNLSMVRDTRRLTDYVKAVQSDAEMAVIMTPTGAARNVLTEVNILMTTALELLRKFDDKCIDGQYGRINDEEV